MSSSSTSPTDRLDVLLADSMVRVLTPEELVELDTLAGAEADAMVTAAEQAAVSAVVALAEENPEPIPTDLSSKLLAQANAHFASTSSSAETSNAPILPGPGSQKQSVILPWMLTAAAVVIAVIGWLPGNGQGGMLSAEEQYQNMIAEAPADLLRLDWTVLEDPTSLGASGDVLWSDSEQRGYMRFNKLDSNDATESQYQLWIFDDKNDTAHPVDGGVFDIPAGETEVIIPIDAKINVKQAFQFAITVEAPGGVVVSKRERIPLLAAIPG